MMETDGSAPKPASAPDRVAFRLGYEAAKELIAHELETVKSYQQRSIVLLSATALVMGVGLRGPSEVGLGTGTGHWEVVGWVFLALGFVASLVGALVLNLPLKGAFDPLPRAIVTNFGDDETAYPNNDKVYRDIALSGAKASEKVSGLCRQRCRWLWGCLAGLPLVVVGLGTLWANAH